MQRPTLPRPRARRQSFRDVREENGGDESGADIATFEEADPYSRRLRDAVHERAYCDGARGVTLFISWVLAALPSPPVHGHVGKEEGHGPEQEPQGRRVEASYLVSLVHELEGDRGNQDPSPERHDGRYGAPRSAGVDTYERPHKERNSPDKPPEPCSQRPHVVSSAASLFSHEPLVDLAILADGLPQLFGGLLVRVFLRAPCRTCHDVGPDAPRLPVIVSDIGVHGSQAPLGVLVGLARVGDEVALVQDVRDGPVCHLYGPLRIVYKDPLDLSPLLLIATAALFGERLDPPLYVTATLPEFPLGLLLRTPLLRDPLILGAKLFPAPLSLLLAPLRSPPP